jgi:hypothetical protein
MLIHVYFIILHHFFVVNIFICLIIYPNFIINLITIISQLYLTLHHHPNPNPNPNPNLHLILLIILLLPIILIILIILIPIIYLCLFVALLNFVL